LNGDKTEILDALKFLAGCLFTCALTLGFMSFFVYAQKLWLVPDLAITVSERD
jgi:hypothetical protein